jgi:hypothetical protein
VVGPSFASPGITDPAGGAIAGRHLEVLSEAARPILHMAFGVRRRIAERGAGWAGGERITEVEAQAVNVRAADRRQRDVDA